MTIDNVEGLVEAAEDWLTFFKYPQLSYEGPEAIDGINLCCPDVRYLLFKNSVPFFNWSIFLHLRADGLGLQKALFLTMFRGCRARCPRGSSRLNLLGSASL